jgi:phage anti-repressor protein
MIMIMLNVDTFKNLCMLVKSDKAKEIRKYYVKLENIYC